MEGLAMAQMCFRVTEFRVTCVEVRREPPCDVCDMRVPDSDTAWCREDLSSFVFSGFRAAPARGGPGRALTEDRADGASRWRARQPGHVARRGASGRRMCRSVYKQEPF